MRSAVCFLLLALAGPAAADWAQYMGDARHTGDSGHEEFKLPLGIVSQTRLDDAILTSPAIVGGRAYVVDQMGTAYCIDPPTGKIFWKTSPDGDAAMGFNTSSPCLMRGRLYYGTTAGTFHILRADNGKVVKTLKIGSPILGAPTFANDSLYFQALDAVLRCIDLDGVERWRWDHYARYKEPAETTKKREPERGHPGSYDRPHYGGGEVVVSEKRVVTSFGWDIVCVEDAGKSAKLLWCNRAPNGRDGAAPMASSILGPVVCNAGMGADGHLGLTRLSLETGEVEKKSGHREAYPGITPAGQGLLTVVRDSSYGKNGVVLLNCANKKVVASWRDDKESTPIGASATLTRNQLVFSTLRGEVILVEIEPTTGAKPFRFKTPHGKGIGSTPAIEGGRIHFGCDDGYFYVIGPDGKHESTRDDKLAIHEPRSKPAGKRGWPSTCGNPGNSSFADEPDLKPPFRVRWASRGFGHFLTPCIAADGDLVSVTLTGLITCQEQATGRMRWRTQMPGTEWSTSSGLLAAGGKLYIPRPTFGSMEGAFFCLDQKTGKQLWKADIGGRYIWERAAPVLAGGHVAFGFGVKGKPPGTMIQSWDADTGKPAWNVELNVAGGRSGSIGGCTDGKTMWFTAGAGAWQWKQEGDKKRGETVAIDAKTGKVRWRSNEVFGTSCPVLEGERLLLNEDGNLRCVAPADGKVLWTRQLSGTSRCSVGEDFLVMRGYGGHGIKLRLEDGKDYPNCRELGGETHAGSPVSLTAKYSFASTVGGLNVRDVKTGELLWRSPGFAPRGCVNPALANGRIFWPGAANATVYCWEPDK